MFFHNNLYTNPINAQKTIEKNVKRATILL